MKRTKAFLLFLLALTLPVSLAGCIVIPKYMYYEIAPETVSSIEIYDLRGEGVYLGSATPAYTVEEEQTADFLSDLAGIRFTDYIIITVAAIDPSFEYGDWVVKINEPDGSYRYISCAGYGETYDAEAQRKRGNHYECDVDEWEAFLSNYVPEELFGAQEEGENA